MSSALHLACCDGITMAVDASPAAQGGILLIQFAREPRVGTVKTRMLPALSAEQACELHCELTLWTCRQLLTSRLGPVELAVTGDTGHALFEQCSMLGVERVTTQRGTDLGQRMYNALQAGLSRYTRVILVGSDCPQIDPSYLRMAAQALHTAQVVLGPATDGGYVLIGARVVEEELFKGIPWGSEQVYAKTVSALHRLRLSWEALPCLSDIDRPEDLALWESLAAGRTATYLPV